MLFQSKDYNSQHAYGKFSSRTQVVNKEFRPPPIERDDLLPLSRIPRPTIVPRINPGTAFATGGTSAYIEQNMSAPQVEKYLTDSVKAGEIRPTFYAPISLPIDNSVLPDLETTLPPTSASAGFRFPRAGGRLDQQDLELEYKSVPISASAQRKFINVNAFDGREDLDLEYKNPQVSAIARANMLKRGLTPVDIEELDYNRPQVSATARENFTPTGITILDFDDFEYNNPQVSAIARSNMPKISTINNGMSSTEILFDTKIAGTQGGIATPTAMPIYDIESSGNGIGSNSVTDSRSITNVSYLVPKSNMVRAENTRDSVAPFYRKKQESISKQHSNHTKGFHRRAGIDIPQVVMKR